MSNKNNDTMQPINIAERGLWALLLRINSLVMPFVIAYIVWEVQSIHKLQMDVEKMNEWKAGFTAYLKDSSEAQARVQGKQEGQITTILSQLAAVNTELGKLNVRLEFHQAQYQK